METLQSNLTNVVTGQIGQLHTDANQVYQSTLVDGSNFYLAGTTTPYTSLPAASSTAQTAYTFASTLASGSIAGNVQSVNDANTMLHNLDTFLNTFANAVNHTQTSASTATSSAASPPPPIFSVPPDSFALTDPVNGSNQPILTVNPSLTTSEIAAGGANGNTWRGPGDNSNTLNMVAVQNQQQSSLQGATLDQNIASLAWVLDRVGRDQAPVPHKLHEFLFGDGDHAADLRNRGMAMRTNVVFYPRKKCLFCSQTLGTNLTGHSLVQFTALFAIGNLHFHASCILFMDKCPL